MTLGQTLSWRLGIKKVNDIQFVSYWVSGLVAWLSKKIKWDEEGRREIERGENQEKGKKEGWGVDEAGENPEMTAVTREQHAKPWKSFPASSKTFMEF